MKNLGQNAMEFAIICVLVTLVAVASIALFGKNMKTFFDNNPAVAKANAESNIIEANNHQNSYVKPVIVNDVEVYFNADGSASMTLENQDINLSSEIIENLDIVFETSGSHGMGLNDTVIEALGQLILEHQDEFPNGDVPFESSFARTKRDQSGTTFAGSANVNSVQLKVGDHYKIINNDQECSGPNCSEMSVQIIDGHRDPITNKFTGTISCEGTAIHNQTLNAQFQKTAQGKDFLVGSAPSIAEWDFYFQEDLKE